MPSKKKPKQPIAPKAPKRTGVIKFGPQSPAVYNYPIAPLPKERQRTLSFYNKKTNKAFSKHYTPPRTEQYENLIREATALQHPLPEPYTADLYAIVNLRFPSHVHGDIDNLVKSVLDGMQGVAFANDRQVKRLDTEIFFDENTDGYIEVLLMRHRPRKWTDRLCLALLEFISEALPF